MPIASTFVSSSKLPARTAALRSRGAALAALAVVMLAGCDALGIESATQMSAKREAEGKAVGAACRHAGRSIEGCYGANKKSDKAAVFAGWREMNDYMRENNIAETNEAAASAPALAASGAAAKTAAAARAGNRKSGSEAG